MLDSGFARNADDEQRLREQLRSRILTRVKINELVCLESVDSTQSFIENKLHSLKEGDLVISKVQTEGRGRWNRVWISQEGGLWMSITLTPSSIEFLPRIPAVATEAVLQTLQDSGLKGCYVKEPNDVYCNGRKIAGVLADGQIVGTSSIVYLGVGINLNNDPSSVVDISRIATSFRQETGRSVDLIEFTALFVENLDRAYDRVVSGK